jgi:SAM-dependent methyltransferase
MVREMTFSSGRYWEARYRGGGTSGAGSYGMLARFKADLVNAFVADNQIASVMDLGCGDGNLLSLLTVRNYVGVDVSPTMLASCATRFPQHRFVAFDALDSAPPAELAMSIDVIFHLVEDHVFADYLRTLFDHATRFVLVYSSNFDAGWPDPHVRHRRVTDRIVASQPAWRLLSHVPNRYPYDQALPDVTSFADFFIYGRTAETCLIRLPAV